MSNKNTRGKGKTAKKKEGRSARSFQIEIAKLKKITEDSLAITERGVAIAEKLEAENSQQELLAAEQAEKISTLEAGSALLQARLDERRSLTNQSVINITGVDASVQIYQSEVEVEGQNASITNRDNL